MKRLLALSLLLMTFGAIGTAFADGLIIIDEPHWPHPHPRPPQWSRPPVPAPRPYAPLEISYHRVTVKIDGQIATTSVDQEFYNPNPDRLEGTYLFPIPKGAHLDKFA